MLHKSYHTYSFLLKLSSHLHDEVHTWCHYLVFLLVEFLSTFLTTPGLMCTPKQSLWSSLCTTPTLTSSALSHWCSRPQALVCEPTFRCYARDSQTSKLFNKPCCPLGAFQFRSELQNVRLYQATGGLHIFVMTSEAIYFLFIIYYMFVQV